MKLAKLLFKSSICMLGLYPTMPASAQVNLQSGLLAYLPMDGNGTDLSGNGNHATAQGSQTFNGLDRLGTYGKSVRFIGQNGQAKMTFGAPLLSNLQAYTLSYWFLMSEGVNGMNLVGQDNVLETAFYTSPSPAALRVWHPVSGVINISLPSPLYNNWRHLLVTGNNSDIKVYLNGVLVHSQSGDFAMVSNNFHCNIGGHVVSQTSTNWLRGNIDELRIYNRMVTEDEVAALASQNHPALSITSVSSTTFCAGSSLTVQYSATGAILPENEYQLQMSNASGNFNTPVILARVAGNVLNGSIDTEIPTGTPSGAGYRFRLVSTHLPAASDPSAQVVVNSIFGDIPTGYSYLGNVDGKNYYLSNGSSGGGTAQNTSVSNGGHLATVYNAGVDTLMHTATLRAGTRLYIGLNDIEQEGNFVWRNNVPLEYVNWAANQPDNWNNEDYVEVRSDNGRWNDRSNTISQRHIMELSPAGNNAYFCLGEDIQLNARTIAGATYVWSGPGGFSSGEQNPLIANGQGFNAGNYTLTVNVGGCSASESIQVSMNLLPSDPGIAVLSDQVCPGTPAQIGVQNTQTGFSYQLLHAASMTPVGAPQNGNGQPLNFSTGNLDATSTFRFLVENTQTACSIVTPEVTAQVLPSPPALTAVNDEVCNSGQLQIGVTGAPSDATYHWYSQPTGGTAVTGLQGNSHSFSSNASTTYHVSVTDSNGCEGPRVPVTGAVRNPLNPPVDLYTGLLLHYKFDGNLQDQSGNGYHATSSGNVTFQEDRKGIENASVFSASSAAPGGNNFINAGNPAKIQQLAQAGQMTISFWMRQTVTWFDDDGRMPLVNKWNDNNLSGWYIGLFMQNPSNMTNRIRWRVNGNTQVTSTVNVPMLEWHHVVCTYNGAQLRIYQNGVLTGTANHTGSIQNVPLNMLIGRFASGNGGDRITYRGGFDELRIYSRALNPSEVLTLHNDESTAFINAPFCDGQGNLSLTTFDFPGATYQWAGPNGFSSSQQNPPAIANADSATYAGAYTLTVTDSTGCTSPAQHAQAVIYEIPAAPGVLNDTICGSGNALLQVQNPQSGVSYRWYTQPEGGSPIAGQNGATLAINDVTASQTRYVSLLRNGCEGPRSIVQAVYVGPVNTSLPVTGDVVCQGNPASITIVNAEGNISYQAFLGGNPVSNPFTGNGTSLAMGINGNLTAGVNTISIVATAPGCNPVTLANTAQVEVLPNTAGTDVVDACLAYTWINGITYTASTNSPSVTLSNQYGCDSLVALNLTIHLNTTGTHVVNACSNYTWIDGNTYTQNNNTATFSLSNQHGCDSLVTLNLSIHQPSAGTHVVSACNSYTWINGATYTASTTSPTFILSNQHGCDSLVTLQLTILPGSSGTDVVSACNSYTWIDGNTYTASNSAATFALTAHNGCDSIVTLHLTILQSPTNNDVVSACSSYTWIDGHTYTASNSTATAALPAYNGCDSLVTLQLTIHQPDFTTDVVHSCESYTWIDGNTYSASNNSATVMLSNQFGCDSTVVLHLSIPVIDVGITDVGGLLIANQDNASYQWFNCDDELAIDGANNQAFDAIENGSYAVIITYEQCTEISACVDVIHLDARNRPGPVLEIYPNPGSGMFHVRSNQPLAGALLTVRTADGRLLLAERISDASSNHSINLQGAAQGLYLLEISWGNNTSKHRLVKL